MDTLGDKIQPKFSQNSAKNQIQNIIANIVTMEHLKNVITTLMF